MPAIIRRSLAELIDAYDGIGQYRTERHGPFNDMLERFEAAANITGRNPGRLSPKELRFLVGIDEGAPSYDDGEPPSSGYFTIQVGDLAASSMQRVNADVRYPVFTEGEIDYIIRRAAGLKQLEPGDFKRMILRTGLKNALGMLDHTKHLTSHFVLNGRLVSIVTPEEIKSLEKEDSLFRQAMLLTPAADSPRNPDAGRGEWSVLHEAIKKGWLTLDEVREEFFALPPYGEN